MTTSTEHRPEPVAPPRRPPAGAPDAAPPERGPTRLRTPLLLGAGVAGLTGYLHQVDPNEPGHYPGCPFLALSGWFCPGCGGLRAVHHLSHGEVDLAMGMNPVVVLLLPVAVVLWVGWVVRAARGLPEWVPSTRAVLVMTAFVVAYWVVRNLPFAEPYLSRLT